MSVDDGQATALTRLEQPEETALQTFMPALSVEQAVQRRQMLVQYVQQVLQPDVDFGRIPGSTKDTLLKPGAEKLCTIFGLTKKFELIERIEDWSGEAHGNEPFFYYLYRCRLSRGDFLIAEADGSCNSRESKYRYRKGERNCPSCGQATIIKGKEEYGGGWLCFTKKGGCGAKFQAGDPAIEEQQVGRVINPDIADSVNTIQKMAAKRALVAATLLAVNASEFFTQDVEDMTPTPQVAPVERNVTPTNAQPQQPATSPRPAPAKQAGPRANGGAVTPTPRVQLLERANNLHDKLLSERKVPAAELAAVLGGFGCQEIAELSNEQLPQYIAALSDLLNASLRQGARDTDEEVF